MHLGIIYVTFSIDQEKRVAALQYHNWVKLFLKVYSSMIFSNILSIKDLDNSDMGRAKTSLEIVNVCEPNLM